MCRHRAPCGPLASLLAPSQAATSALSDACWPASGAGDPQGSAAATASAREWTSSFRMMTCNPRTRNPQQAASRLRFPLLTAVSQSRPAGCSVSSIPAAADRQVPADCSIRRGAGARRALLLVVPSEAFARPRRRRPYRAWSRHGDGSRGTRCATIAPTNNRGEPRRGSVRRRRFAALPGAAGRQMSQTAISGASRRAFSVAVARYCSGV